jgi:hypothetical protein
MKRINALNLAVFFAVTLGAQQAPKPTAPVAAPSEKKAEAEKPAEPPAIPGDQLAAYFKADGDVIKASADPERGFQGNISGSPLFITDGHLLIRRSAIDAMKVGDIAECEWYLGKKPSDKSIAQVWEPALSREQVAAGFIGCATVNRFHLIDEDKSGEKHSVDLAVFRDAGDRVLIVDPHPFAFIVSPTHPDTSYVAKGTGYGNLPCAFHKMGELVALLIPMRYSEADLNAFDLSTPFIELETLKG